MQTASDESSQVFQCRDNERRETSSESWAAGITKGCRYSSAKKESSVLESPCRGV